MRIGQIDFPKELLDAFINSELVIFAGAGISYDPPSCYPNFDGLVDTILSGSSINREDGEKPDRSLGRAFDSKVKVHDITRRIFSNSDSKPNHYHKTIIRLFNDERDLRIITTNFDTHFTTALKEANINHETSMAPSLPIGQKFQGLAYLHGCADGPADRLVLTDADFSRGYMTEGWARRFLLGVYEKYTVLFIGYSHSDTVLSYLTRGLTTKNKKLYALTCKGQEDNNWELLGITPIEYPPEEKQGIHIALKDSLVELHQYLSMNYIEHDKRIREILSCGPPEIDSKKEDYLLEVIRDPATVKSFFVYANKLEWFQWAQDKGLLDKLFSKTQTNDTPEISRVTNALAMWFASKLIVNNPDEALEIYGQQGNYMNPILWQHIAYQLAYKEELQPDALSKWVTLLIQNYPPGENILDLEALLLKCAKMEEWSLALILFQHLTLPIILYKKSTSTHFFALSNYSIGLLGSYHALNSAWEEFLSPKISLFAESICGIAVQQIRYTDDLSKCHGISRDYLSSKRMAIEPHEQDFHQEDFDLLINVCRDCIEWLLNNSYARGQSLIEGWLQSSSPTLQRIAVHGITEDKNIGADEKIRLMIDKVPLVSDFIRHELFRLLKEYYPESNSDVRQALIKKAVELTNSKLESFEEHEDILIEHDYFEFIDWLYKATGETCEFAEEELNRIKDKYPEFEPREHADILIPIRAQAIWGSKSQYSADELHIMSMSKLIELLLSFESSGLFEPSREGLLEQMAIAIKDDPDFGISLMNNLAQTEKEIPDDVWEQIYYTLQDSDLNDDQWDEILSFIMDKNELLKFDFPIARILQKGIKKEECSIPYALLEKAEEIALKVWNTASIKDETIEVPTNDDWLNESINDTGGVLADFFIHNLSLRRKIEGSYKTGISSELIEYFNNIIEENSSTAAMGRVFLAYNLYYLFMTDPQWTVEHLIPLFDWDNNELQAEQVWQGYLLSGSCSDDLLIYLIPYYEQSFRRIDSKLVVCRDCLTQYIAIICIHSPLTVARDFLLEIFMNTIDVDSRISFARSIKKILDSLNDDKTKNIWNDWLSKYWDKRLDGKPPLDSEESAIMVEWALCFATEFPSVVERIIQHKEVIPITEWIFRDLNEKGIPSLHPIDTSCLLLYLAEYSAIHFNWPLLGLDQTIDILIEHHKSYPDEESSYLRDALNMLWKNCYMNSLDFLRRLDSGDSIDKGNDEDDNQGD